MAKDKRPLGYARGEPEHVLDQAGRESLPEGMGKALKANADTTIDAERKERRANPALKSSAGKPKVDTAGVLGKKL